MFMSTFPHINYLLLCDFSASLTYLYRFSSDKFQKNFLQGLLAAVDSPRFYLSENILKSSRFKFPSLLAFSCEEKDFHLDVKDGNCTIRERFWPIGMCLRDVNRGLTRKEGLTSHAKQNGQ